MFLSELTGFHSINNHYDFNSDLSFLNSLFSSSKFGFPLSHQSFWSILLKIFFKLPISTDLSILSVSMDKKVIPPPSSSQEKACQYSTDRASIINNRRRSIYKQLSSDKKEALLLQRRTRYQQLRNKNLLGGSPTPLPTVQLQFTGQKGLAITDIPPHPETGDTSCVDTSAVVSGKAKDMIGCLSIFEVGSTSAAPVKQHSPIAITVTTKGSASLAHQQYDPKAITDKNNDNDDDHSTCNVVYNEIIQKALL
ncbi:hypothetical protein AABB24_009320 [Solanum stoloniferum]|uniref:BZIP domain-containing protein n=1 Tax=Solanum stoloniferum TaxID=62892 RepID=A0ABD2UIG1_9SOLN